MTIIVENIYGEEEFNGILSALIEVNTRGYREGCVILFTLLDFNEGECTACALPGTESLVKFEFLRNIIHQIGAHSIEFGGFTCNCTGHPRIKTLQIGPHLRDGSCSSWASYSVAGNEIQWLPILESGMPGMQSQDQVIM